jgi:hypothetical protein
MQTDLLILTVYFICIGYVLYQMALSLAAEQEDKVNLLPDGETLLNTVRSQLVQQRWPQVEVELLAAAQAPLMPGLALQVAAPVLRAAMGQGGETPMGQVVVQVLPQGPQTIQPIRGLEVKVLNQTSLLQATVDWDRSSFTLTNNQVHRVIRYTPGQRMELGISQVPSIVNPNQFLSTLITSEMTFERHPDTHLLYNAQALIDPEQLMRLPAPMRTFSLDLMLQLTPMAGRGMRPMVLLLPFRFQMERLPGESAIPLVNWLAKR